MIKIFTVIIGLVLIFNLDFSEAKSKKSKKIKQRHTSSVSNYNFKLNYKKLNQKQKVAYVKAVRSFLVAVEKKQNKMGVKYGLNDSDTFEYRSFVFRMKEIMRGIEILPKAWGDVNNGPHPITYATDIQNLLEELDKNLIDNPINNDENLTDRIQQQYISLVYDKIKRASRILEENQTMSLSGKKMNENDNIRSAYETIESAKRSLSDFAKKFPDIGFFKNAQSTINSNTKRLTDAAKLLPSPAPSSTTTNNASSLVGSGCITAGYVSSYIKHPDDPNRVKCPLPSGNEEGCSAGKTKCNEAIFGSVGGKAICVSKNNGMTVACAKEAESNLGDYFSDKTHDDEFIAAAAEIKTFCDSTSGFSEECGALSERIAAVENEIKSRPAENDCPLGKEKVDGVCEVKCGDGYKLEGHPGAKFCKSTIDCGKALVMPDGKGGFKCAPYVPISEESCTPPLNYAGNVYNDYSKFQPLCKMNYNGNEYEFRISKDKKDKDQKIQYFVKKSGQKQFCQNQTDNTSTTMPHAKVDNSDCKEAQVHLAGLKFMGLPDELALNPQGNDNYCNPKNDINTKLKDASRSKAQAGNNIQNYDLSDDQINSSVYDSVAKKYGNGSINNVGCLGNNLAQNLKDAFNLLYSQKNCQSRPEHKLGQILIYECDSEMGKKIENGKPKLGRQNIKKEFNNIESPLKIFGDFPGENFPMKNGKKLDKICYTPVYYDTTKKGDNVIKEEVAKHEVSLSDLNDAKSLNDVLHNVLASREFGCGANTSEAPASGGGPAPEVSR